MVSTDATVELWYRLARPFDPVSAVEAVTGLSPLSSRQVVGLCLATSREADTLLDRMGEIVRSLAIATTTSPSRYEGEVRGPILWSETVSARSASPGAGAAVVCASPVKAYDTDENRVLRFALSLLRDAARDASPSTPALRDDDRVRRARHNGTRAVRALEHRTLSSVSRTKPDGRAVQKARTGSRARIYRPAVELLRRAPALIDAKTVAAHCDDHTRRQHGLLLALADSLELGEFRVIGHVLTNHGIRYVHPHRADAEGVHGVLLRKLLLDVPDPTNGIDAAQAERNLVARAGGRPALVVKGLADVDLAVRLTAR